MHRLAAGSLALSLALASWGAGAADEPTGVAELLRSARLWNSLDRPDTARRQLLKVLAVQADQPQALLMLGELELRSNKPADAQRYLALLQQRHPGDPATRELAQLSRLYTRDKAQLTQLRLLRRGGNTEQALALARTLFPDGLPPGELAEEFAPLLASTPAGWEAMRRLLSERIARSGSPRDRLALYDLLAQRSATLPQAVQGYAELAAGHDIAPQRLLRPWRRALEELPEGSSARRERQRFLAQYPQDETVLKLAAGEGRTTPPGRAAAVAVTPAERARSTGLAALDANQFERAEAELNRALALNAGDARALGGLGLLRLRQGRHAEAQRWFEQAAQRDPAQRQRWAGMAATAAYWGGLAEAERLRDAGQIEPAAALAEAAHRQQPRETEAALLLAALRQQQGRGGEAEQLLRELPQEPRARNALLALLMRSGRAEQAVIEVERLRGTPGFAAANALDAGALRDAADAQITARRRSAALHLLERAVALLPDDPWLRYDLARLYAGLRLQPLAEDVMAEGRQRRPGDPAMRYASALVEAAADRDDEALALLDAVPPAERTDGMNELAQRLRFERSVARAREAQVRGATAEAARWRAQALAEAGADADRRVRVAGLLAAAGERDPALALLATVQADPKLPPAEAGRVAQARAELLLDSGQAAAALSLLDPLLRSAPDDAELYLLRAQAHAALGQPAAMQKDLGAMRALLPDDDTRLRLSAIRLVAASDRATARRWMAELLQRRPGDHAVLLEAARQAERDGRYEQALALLRRVQAGPAQSTASAGGVPLLALGARPSSAPAPVPDGDLLSAANRIAAIEARRQPLDEVGWFPYRRESSAGSSTLRGNELSLVHVRPRGFDGHWFAQVDAVQLDAGSLPADVEAAGLFGRVQSTLPADLKQHASGLSMGIGWRGENRRFDIGVIGAGFLVPNLVGGWRESGSWRGNDLSLELSRRVLTSSLLAYAGTRDPVTGQAWGGVTNTGLSLRLGRDFAAGFSASTSLRAGVLTGRHVKTNTVVQWRNAVDRDWLKKPDFTLNAGLVLNLWHYDNNQGFYSFGHGSYYSPQAYASLGVPVEVRGRRGDWSYDLRGSLSRSRTYEASAPFYPTDGALQARTDCSAAPVSAFCDNGQPRYAGGGQGGGLGRSLRGDVEYRLDPHWAMGASFNIDRSAFYSPTQLLFYLRRSLSPQTGAVTVPPRPVVPYSQF